MTQEEIATKLGISRQTYNGYEQGQPMQTDLIYKAARVLKVAVSDLLPD